ncbi:hypothetical protein AVEN_214247-1 [Araneus ventricosus]|uniref:Uncharacterized protein n=1 Tax=Araneus ventricosus TaxID=182803 RepID=A0A4Y2RFD9_ARAVE|nr:hypothetical protein AVEN_214247-1 [Araneus ventricosus]
MSSSRSLLLTETCQQDYGWNGIVECKSGFGYDVLFENPDFTEILLGLWDPAALNQTWEKSSIVVVKFGPDGAFRLRYHPTSDRGEIKTQTRVKMNQVNN